MTSIGFGGEGKEERNLAVIKNLYCTGISQKYFI
jgi:hypothetical protein